MNSGNYSLDNGFRPKELNDPIFFSELMSKIKPKDRLLADFKINNYCCAKISDKAGHSKYQRCFIMNQFLENGLLFLFSLLQKCCLIANVIPPPHIFRNVFCQSASD